MKKRVLSLFLAITLCLTLTPTGALAAEGQPPEQTVSVTQVAETGADENAPPANLEETPTENVPAAAEKNTVDKEVGKGAGKEAGQNEPTVEGENKPLALNDAGQDASGGENGETGGTSISEEDTRTEIWCVGKPDSIGRGYDGTTDGGTIPIDLTFTDGTNEIKLKEGTGFTAKKTFDSADAGWHTVTVEIALIGEAAVKYKLKAGEETFTIGGNINKAYPDLTVTLSKTACTAGEKLLPLLSVEGAPEDAEVTYYYLASALKSWAGSSDIEGSEAMPKIGENTAISEPGTYYVYAKTGETKNYKEERSATVELTVNEPVVEAASVTKADGTDGGTYESLPAALNAAQNGDTVKLLADHVTDTDALNALGDNFTFEQYASIVPVVTKTLTLDLNHKTVDYLEVGFSETNEETQKKETLATGNLTVTGEGAYGRISNLMFMAGALDIRSGEIGGSEGAGLVCDVNSGTATISNGMVYGLTVLEGASVTVNGGSNHAGAWVVASGATLNITDGTFGDVQFTRNGTIAISGGTFQSIKSYIAEELQPLMSLLDTQKVHAFYKGDDVQDGNATELADVTVKEHTHTMVNNKCACGFSCTHTNTEGTSTIDKDGKCTVCGTQFAAGIGETYYTDVPSALDAATDGQTVKLLANAMLPDGIYVSKTLTLDLDGHSLSGYSLNVGGRTVTGNLTVIDSSGGNGAVGVTVRDGGTLVFDPKNDHTTLLQLEVWGGTVELYGGKISRSGLRLNNSITLGNLLPQKAGLAYYCGDTQLTLKEAASQTCDLVVKSCSHGGKNGFDKSATTCPYCNAPAVAETALYNSEGNRLQRRFADLQTALDADRDGGATLKLLADVTGDYTIDGTQDTGLNLNGHSIKGTVTVKGIKGDKITTTLSNTENTTTVSIDAVVAYKGAKLAGSGKPAVIGTLTLAEGATWKNILNLKTLGYKVLNSDGTYKWYAPNDVKGSQLNNVIINSPPITTKTLNLKVDGKSLTGNPPKVERGTTVQLCAGCNKDAEVYIYTGEIVGNNMPTYSRRKAEYQKIGTNWYYVVDLPCNTIGKYSVYFTATKDGYTVQSTEKKLTVTKPNLSNAEITFPYGNEAAFNSVSATGVPTFVVTYKGQTLEKDVDFTITGGDSTYDVGPCTLTIKATDNGDYTGSKSAQWTVRPLKVAASVGDIIKTYDGTTDLPANTKITFTSADSYYTGTTLRLAKGTDYEVLNACYDSPDAGIKTVSFTIKLKNKGYVFDDGTTQKDFTLNGADFDDKTFQIKKATAPMNNPAGTLNIINGTQQTYTYDFNNILPGLPKGKYGTISYGQADISLVSQSGYYYDETIVEFKKGVLTLAQFYAKDGKMTGQIGTVKVNVTTTNYADFQLKLVLYAVDQIKPEPDGTITATPITYGDTLSMSTITGKMKDPNTGKSVSGTFTWTNGTIKPDANDNYEADWTFTPAAGYEKYATVTGTVTIKVNKAAIPTNAITAPAANALTYNGNDQALITAGMTNYGTMQYSLTENGTYSQDIPTGTDAGAYTVWYRVIGDPNHNDTAPASVAVSIGKKPLTITGVTAASKPYDGTTNADISSVTFDNVTLNRGTDYTVTASFDDASVGNGKNITATVTLMDQAAKNYALEQSSFTTTGSITKAAIDPSDIQLYQTVFNDLAKTYKIDLNQFLDTILPEGGKYGDIQYGKPSVFMNSDYYPVGGATIGNGNLSLSINKAASSNQGDEIGTVTVQVETTNYQPFTLTIHVSLQDKLVPVLAEGNTVSASEITYGQTLVDSKLTVNGTMKDPNTSATVDGTFTWTDGTIKPDAGSYDAEWTFTPAEGYEEYETATGTVTVKVKPAKLIVSVNASSMYYTGEEQIASIIASGQSVDSTPVTFTYSDKEDGNYTSGVPRFTDAGTYTVYYKAEAANHEPATGTFTVTIAPLPIRLLSVSSISKTYDGSADVTLTADKLTFFSKTANIKLPDKALSFSNAQFTKQQADGSYLPSPEVGNGKALSFTMTLTSKNYVFEGESEGTTEVSDVFATDDANRFTITKAAAPTMQPIELTVINGLAKTYLVNLPALPTLGDNCKYGSIEYEACNFDLIGEGGYANSTATITSNDEFQLTVPAVESQTEGSVGTVGVKITTDNYQDMLLTVEVIAKNKIVPVMDGTISASEITYGDTLSKSEISGKMKDPNTGAPVDGTFAWKNGTIQPDANDSYEAEWTFTPDAPEYAALTGKTTVKVAPKSIEGATLTLEKDSLEYNAAEQSPKITGVTLEGWSETITYHIVGGDKATNANDSITLTIEGTGNYTGTATAEWKITPAELTVSVQSVDKEYDGTTNATVAPTFNGLKNRETLTAADYSVTAAFDNANVGYYKTVTGTVTLKQTDTAKNYVLRDAGKFSTDNGTIAKAVAPTVQPVELTIYNGVQGDYYVDLPPLPTLGKGKTYGTEDYNNPHTINLSEGYTAQSALVADPENLNTLRLMLRMNQTGSLTGEIGTVTIPVETSNYKDINLIVNVKAENQTHPKVGTFSAGAITYGQPLSASTITGTMQDPNTGATVTGTFTWDTPAVNPNAGSHDAKWTFTPDKSYGGKYTTNTGTATVTVAKRGATVTPDNKSKVYEENDPKLTYKISGVLDGETLKGITLARAEGENAGEYDITGTADAGANPNYNVTFAKGTFTIKPKSIQSATVMLGKGLAANGAEQTQTVEKVLLGDKEIPADSYTVTGNTATAHGIYTLTITAKGNYKDFVKWTYVIAPSKAEDAPGEDITIGSGKVKVDVQSEGTVPPATLLTDKAELLAMLVNSGDITADELVQIANGASVDIVLTVKEANVPDAVKTAMAQAAKDYTIGQYLDISLFKYMTVNGSQQACVALHTTKDALTISVVVPDALINTNSAVNRTYCIVRNHKGTMDVLDTAFDAASKTLTFKSDRFSIYAIAYKDTAVPSSGSNPGSNNSSNDSETKKNEVAAPTPAPTPASTSKPSTITAMPQTGDTSNPTLYVVLLVASLLGLAVVFVCKKRNDK